MAEKGSILVVDNESDQLEMMREVLGRIGFDARTTDNPQQALEMVKDYAFCLIFIDLIMSEMDGTDLCEQIKQIRPEVCIYAFSGHVHLYSPEQLERAGFDGAIGKPATMEEIKAALNRALSLKMDSQPTA
ncbi:response regulator [Desulfosarcina sp.]|uniref:response regulator n=1 Tax=Desulfosarcina sp. TaxID=2027861 RepID=UPI00356648D7